ncbi:hypothetical protein vseg_020449 [Gypsophila vaccaria]
MGSYRSPYPMISESSQDTSVPQFSWFHPGNYMSAMRGGINPFQGSQHNPEEITTIPINEAANAVEPEPKPDKITKKPKTSKKNLNTDAPKEPKPKPSQKGTSSSLKPKNSGLKRERKSPSSATSMDDSGTLSPFCSCTGVARQCYRWGSGGWQSACCTTNISEYPLPMSVTRPSSRTPGRKMSHGAFVKLLQRLASEGYDLSTPIDLKDHWARHGTNKFVIIK